MSKIFRKYEVFPLSNTLVIKGHPLTSETSFSLKALDQFLSTYEAANPSDTITVLDVFADNVPEIDADIASAFNALAAGTEFGDLSADQQAKVGRFGELTDQFLVADKIVIALTSMKIDITDSCSILGMNKNTMYRRRNTIKERLRLDKTVDFETWIHERVARSLAR